MQLGSQNSRLTNTVPFWKTELVFFGMFIYYSINRKRNFNDYLEKCELPPSNVSGDVPFLLIHHLSSVQVSKGLLAKIKVKRSSGSYAKDWLDQLFVFPCDMYTILMCRY